MTGNHQYWGGTGSSEEPSLTFSSLNSQYGTSAIQAKGELWMECLQNIHFNSNGTNKHSASGCKSYGGAIYISGSARINDNYEVLFDGNFNNQSADPESSGGEYSNSANIYGGSLYLATDSVLECNNNRKIQLSNNAITISFADYYSSSPTKNYAYGGAIAAGDSATIRISKNDTVDISFNKILTTYYSASYGRIYDSSWSYGGAIYVGSGTKNFIQDNVDVSVKNNSSTANPYHGYAYSYGGALYIGSKSSLSISRNSSASFSDNYARATYVRDVLHGARSYSYGGALYISESSSVEIKENSNVEFANNYVYSSAYDVARGGAIYAAKGTSIAIENNERCIFRGNAQLHTDSEFVFENSLNSIYSIGNEITLKVGEGQEILFYDPIYAKADTGLLTISYNAKHTNSESDSICPSGDIVFSALYAQEDLAKHKPNYEQSELSASKRTEIYAITHLYGGRLRVEDGAMYMGNGIIAEINSAATVRVKNATLSHSGYDLSFNAGTTLDLGGVNSITAKTLDMKDGSIMSFTLGKDNLTTAAVTLTGTFKQGGALTISLADDGTMERENKYALLTIASGATPETWDISKLTVEGIGATLSDLSWSNGTLYYSAPLPELLTATWSGGQSRVWNTTDKNWTQGEYSYAYKDGVDVVFGDTGSGSVSLEGTLAPKSVLVENTADHDYVLESSGKLSGATSLTKNGEGKLTINTANDYTGGTVLNGGTLVAGSGTAFGVGAIQISNGTLDLGGNSLANDISALNADVIVRNGSLTGDFTISGGSLDASELHIETQTLIVTASGEVSFHNAGDATSGGAVYGGEYSTISLKDNEAVTFSENNADAGGAVFGAFNTINLEGNAAVTFSGNYSSSYNGGAIYGYGNTINLEGNAAVTFSGNTSSYLGGAIYGGNSIIRLKDNEVVTFTGNSANDGGAICGECDSVIFEGNAVVTFSGNSAHRGGAIYTYGISMLGNDSVSFSGNYEKTESGDSLTYRLRSVYMAGGTLTLAAGEGQDIMFYDTLYAAVGTEVSFNDDFTDKEGVTQKGTGDIVFSGKLAEQNLRELKTAFTQQELTDSLTTEVYATTNLYGGRLRIEDGAIYKGNGINVAAGSNAALRLAGGTLDQAGYDVLLNAGTTLDLAGENNITASTLEMMDGSTLSFNAGATEGVMLNLDAALKTGDLHVTVSGDLTKEYALLQLADVSQYDFTQWNSGQVSVSGADYEHLIWKDGVLTYKPWESTHTDLDKDTEVDDFGGEEGVDIEGNTHKLTVKHPVDLVHLAMENGVVRLEGADNNVVRITLTDDGTLQLAAGAGLNVGNIVSMVANGSADLEISGDIEISDIKAYGRTGNKGTLSYVNMTTAGDYTIENMTITGSVIDVGEGTTLYLVNVDIKADTHITDDPAWVFAQNANIQLDKTNTWVDKEITAAQDTLLYMCGDTQRSITLAAGSEVVELTSSMFDSVTLTGTDLWLDMTGIAEATYNKDYFTLDFQDLARKMAKAQVDVENLHVYATLDGERYTEAYSTANGGLTTTLYFQVPEPATGTLSLLALAALAARRKKK